MKKRPVGLNILVDPQSYLDADKGRQLKQRERELLGNIRPSGLQYERTAFKSLYAELPPDRQHTLTLEVTSKLLEVAKDRAEAAPKTKAIAKTNADMCAAVTELAVDALEHHVSAQPGTSEHLKETGTAAGVLARYAGHWQLSSAEKRARRMAIDCDANGTPSAVVQAFAQSVPAEVETHLEATRHNPALAAALINVAAARIRNNNAYTHEVVNVPKAATVAYQRFGHSPAYHQAAKGLARTLIETGKGRSKGAKVAAILISAMPEEDAAPLTATWTAQTFKPMVEGYTRHAVTLLKAVEEQTCKPLPLQGAWDMLATRVAEFTPDEAKHFGFRHPKGLPTRPPAKKTPGESGSTPAP